jgi:hypothetical protein
MVWKDVPADPAIELARLVAADEVQQPAAIGPSVRSITWPSDS